MGITLILGSIREETKINVRIIVPGNIIVFLFYFYLRYSYSAADGLFTHDRFVNASGS